MAAAAQVEVDRAGLAAVGKQYPDRALVRLELLTPPAHLRPLRSRPREPAGTSRPTSTPGSLAPWPRTSGTTDPAAREAAVGLLAPPVLAHAALLAELARLVPRARADELALTTS
ncbi:hypothetical protein AB0A76_28365 [Streptomyces exfoliatus]|uniref:Uncharacterized protein n=1 Tax=Streptomyces exfoliatus TaxID=1905 RepID=A0ABV3D3L3_STREX